MTYNDIVKTLEPIATENTINKSDYTFSHTIKVNDFCIKFISDYDYNNIVVFINNNIQTTVKDIDNIDLTYFESDGIISINGFDFSVSF